jgi:hypothetical protein
MGIPWWVILLVVVVVVGLMITKECPSNCTKSGPLGLGCTCQGKSGVYYTGIHIGN